VVSLDRDEDLDSILLGSEEYSATAQLHNRLSKKETEQSAKVKETEKKVATRKVQHLTGSDGELRIPAADLQQTSTKPDWKITANKIQTCLEIKFIKLNGSNRVQTTAI